MSDSISSATGGEVDHVDDHWFEAIARHLGPTYLRYSFTKGTRQEIDFLVSALGIDESHSILDIGCGPGRHALELARRGVRVHGIDISSDFVEVATETAAQQGVSDLATFERRDARSLVDSPWEGMFDRAICLCQGGFGLMLDGEDDERILQGIGRCLRVGGRLALSAFNAYFAVKYHKSATFDADTGVAHELTRIVDSRGESVETDLWTGCFTPRELRRLLADAGMGVDHIYSVEPGRYGPNPASVESPEFLVLGTVRGGGSRAQESAGGSVTDR